MSKSSTATVPKIPTQLPAKSAWAKGPPASSSRSQSPAPSAPPSHPTHSRRPSALGPNIPIKDGVGISRNVGAATKQGGPSVSFGSIDDVNAPISSSPAPTPAPSMKADSVKSFGTVPATVSQVNGQSSVQTAASIPPAASSASAPSSVPPNKKFDVKKFFQGSPSTSAPSQPSSPNVRPASISQPSASTSQPPPSQYQQFVPQNGMRQPQQNPGQNGSSGSGPKSPPYRHQAANPAGSRMSNGPSGPSQMSGGMGSPRLSPHPPPGQMPPPMQQMWPYGYYPAPPTMDPQYMPQYAAAGGWYIPGQMPPQQPHAPGGHIPPHNGMPMSPRNPSVPMPGPGTPTPSHATPASHVAPPPPMSHTSSGSIGGMASPPPTPSSTNRPYNPNANTFVPRSNKVSVSLKSADGKEIDLHNLKHQSPAQVVHALPPVVSPPPASPGRRPVIRMESETDKMKRLQIEGNEERAKQKAKQEADEKAKKEKEEKQKAEREAKEKEELAVREKEREEREAREKQEREAQEKKRKEEEEAQERIRKEEEAKQRLAEETARTEAAAKLKLEAEAEAKRKASEEAEAEVKRKAETEASAEAEAAKAKEVEVVEVKEEAKEEVSEEPEEGELSEEKEAKPEKESLKIDTSGAPSELPRRRPGPLDLSSTRGTNIQQPLPSALATARIINDLGTVPYPEGIRSPNIDLNIGAKDGKFRYDREFLMQFMSICKEKPDHLPPLDAIGLDPTEPPNYPMSRGGSGRHNRQASASTPQRQASVSGAFNGSSFGKAANPFSMGNFSTLQNSKLTSEERFNRAASVGSAGGAGFPRPTQMQRTASQGGPGAPMGSNRVRSKRGEKRNDGNRAPNSQQHGSSGYGSAASLAQAMLEPVAPLQASANRWDRRALAQDSDSPEMVDRKVKSLLNKLTMEKFDSISDQIIAWANKSENEKDGRTLIQVIRLVFEKATDEAAWSEMYARLCRKMMEQISPKVQDDGIKNADGKPIAGGQLFRKYLLNRCQEDFERGWVAKEAAAAAAAHKATEDNALKVENDKKKSDNPADDEEYALYSEEYYAAQKAKRQGLGLIKFIGELFKLQMLTERIMHECVKKLLGNVENPEEEEIESLCKLISTVGQMLDTQKARAHMDVYFSRMKELTKSANVSSRMQFMLQDVLELRERRWNTRNTVAAPSTIAQVRENAAKEKAAAEKESYQRTISMSRGGSRRGGERGDASQIGPDGWAVAGGAPRPPPKAGDLSKFGQISKGTGGPLTFGPQSNIYSGKKDKRESIQRTNSSSSNMFSMLQSSENPAEPAAVAAKEPPMRRKLVLQPRSKPVESSGDGAPSSEPEHGSEDEVESPVADAAVMSDADAKKTIDEDVKEFFAVRNLEEADNYFQRLPAAHHHSLVDKLVSLSLESKESDAQLVTDFFKRAKDQHLCENKAFEDGFTPIVEFLDDIAIDAPMAYKYMANMIRAVEFSEEERTRIASKLPDSSASKLLALLS